MVAIALAVIASVGVVFCRSVAVEAAYPIEHAKDMFCRKVWARIAGAYRGSKASAENVRLRREIASLAMVRGDAERMEAENARLRKLLEYSQARPSEWVVAAVLSEGGSQGVGRTIRVDKGSLAGITQGASVVVPEGLVGLVTAVTPSTSEITLLTDSSVKVSCAVERDGMKRVLGILSGGDDERLVLRHLTDCRGLAPRSRVVTSGLGGVFPRGLEIGALLSVTNVATLAEGEVLPSVDFSALEDVFIRREK